MSYCCPIYRYPCLYGNSEQSFTKECEDELYFRDNGPVTATVGADTIYTECASKSNAIALELAQDEAESETYCMGCCTRSVCVFLSNPEDVANFEYFTIAQGVYVNALTELCFQKIYNCPNDQFGFFVRFGSIPSQSETTTSNGCLTLQPGIVYSFQLGTSVGNSLANPEQFSIGWDCNLPCPVKVSMDNTDVLTFPFGIAQCDDGFPE